MRSSETAVARALAPITPTVNINALKYTDEQVLARLMSEHGMTAQEANELFEDTLKFLALQENGLKLSPPAKIDLGWHNFLLHTRQYATFCESCFGHFIHHEPGSGTTNPGARLDVEETVTLAKAVYGDLSSNWDNIRGETCGSNGC